ncbi:MAG: putative magnesium protoporphyrin chelatase [Bryobacterales bacterium]|nr:putative magnesium protoporphyrin chelatase [Bryobacterales bacterium]
MPLTHPELPRTLGELRRSAFSEDHLANRSVKDELRTNLIARLRNGEPLFPGIVGYEDTVVPQVVNALLSRHNFILLGLRGQAKTRLVRMLTAFLDPWTPYVAGCEIHDNPYSPICKQCRTMIAEHGETAPIGWLAADDRYVEKLATPDVTIADMIGDIDPIKAARRGQDISDELTVHYGLLPRANRGIFAINELPDLAGKIQVGLFNIMQEGDVQIKGYPVRLPLDLLLVFTANPEDYTARGKIITPLKDRIGSEIRTHYPAELEQGMAITSTEAWLSRGSSSPVRVPKYISEVVEQLAFSARDDRRVDKRSGVSQRLPISVMENVVSNAERRAYANAEVLAVPRVGDIYAALPAITGKIELEYEGELKGGDAVARELIRVAVSKVFDRFYEGVNMQPIVHWFELGGSLKLPADGSASQVVSQLNAVPALMEKTRALGLSENEADEVRASAGEFILEGLYARRRLSRSEELGFTAGERKREDTRPRRGAASEGEDLDEEPPSKSRRYN